MNSGKGKKNPNYKHGLCVDGKIHSLYSVLSNMKRRCGEKSYAQYKDYGGRGISVCDEWANDTSAFVTWAQNNGWVYGLTIDRIDNDGSYSPENCRFVTREENNRNQRKRSNSPTIYTGVYFTRGKWRVQACGNHVGSYQNIIDAAVARDSYAINNNLKLPLNFPQPITEIRNAKR